MWSFNLKNVPLHATRCLRFFACLNPTFVQIANIITGNNDITPVHMTTRICDNSTTCVTKKVKIEENFRVELYYIFFFPWKELFGVSMEEAVAQWVNEYTGLSTNLLPLQKALVPLIPDTLEINFHFSPKYFGPTPSFASGKQSSKRDMWNRDFVLPNTYTRVVFAFLGFTKECHYHVCQYNATHLQTPIRLMDYRWLTPQGAQFTQILLARMNQPRVAEPGIEWFESDDQLRSKQLSLSRST